MLCGYFISLVLLLSFHTGIATKSAHLVTTQPVRVPYGRSVFVNPKIHVALKYPPRAHCRVDVVRDNPLSERNGFLVPDVFACDFKLGSVRYTHLGSKFHTHDIVKLLIRIDSDNETQVVPFQLKIVVLFVRMDVVRKNLPVVVPKVGGVSPSISKDVLKFVYDSENQLCQVSVLRLHTPMPRYGDLLNVTTSNSRGTRFECDEFFTSDIRYQHKKLNSSNRDFVSLVVEILDKTLSVAKREYFQIIIRILGARVNERPTGSFQASNSLEVKDQSLGAVTSRVLASVDLETNDEEIIFNVSKPLQEGEGQLINLDDPYQPVTAFYQRDVQRLKIAYRPPTVSHGKSRMFQVILNAIDTEGAISDPILLLILVKATNVNAPIVIKNAGMSLYEGQARTLSRHHNLHIEDNDNYDDVSLEVVDGLHNGKLKVMKTAITKFMARDLDTDKIIYYHDGSDTYSDNVVFRMTDRTHVVEFVFAITIAPVDDQPPYLVYNTGLILDEGGVARIDQHMLSAYDVDSDDMQIEFNIALPNITAKPHPTSPIRPPTGLLFLRTKSIDGEESDQWTIKPDGFYERNTSRFSQKDIVKGRVFYRHLGGEVFRDDIHFILSDDAVKANVSPLQTFTILINRVDDLPPIKHPSSSLNINANEYTKTVLNWTVLRYMDNDSEDINLLYTISRCPFFIDRVNSTEDAGSLIRMENGLPIMKFTQMELKHGKIVYQPPDIEIGVFPRHAQFEFSVADLAGNSVREQVASIRLQPVNNKAPKVKLSILEVEEFSETIISQSTLWVSDQDTPMDQVMMSITRLPGNGVITLDSVALEKEDVFTMRDILASVLKYRHIKSGESSDEARIVIYDQVHKKDALLEITITKATRNTTRTTLNITLSVKEQSRETLRIPCCFESNKEKKPTLQVMTPPRVGRILLNDRTSNKFMIDDVMSGRVSYEHTGDETGLKGDADHFDMVLINESLIMAGRVYKSLKVMTRIVPVDNKPPRVFIKQPLTLREGGKARLSERQVIITDQDTPDSNVKCTIDVQPTYGYLENVLPSPGSEISNAGKRITSFTAMDVKNGNINYVQSKYKGIEPRADWSAFSCTDTNNTSPRYLLNIVILPNNDEAPQLYNRDFVTEEGAELVIDVTLLNAMDDDAPMDELMFHVVTPPKHGIITDTRIEGQLPVTKFTLTQIMKSTSIVYIHDGSETLKDSIHLAVSDGIHNTSKTIPFTILPVDDEQPRLVVNKGLRLRFPGESGVLTPQNLKAVDIDSLTENITFVLRVAPKAGVLERLSFNGLTNLSKHDVFTQTDIERRLIVYNHNKGSYTAMDVMYFDVTDGTNTLLNRPFYVFIKTNSRLPPTVINKSIRLSQGAAVTITTDFLSVHDFGNENVQYTLRKQPSQGHLELTSKRGVPVKSFRQLDIASNKLIYVHTSDKERAGDSFDFEVIDDSRSRIMTRRFLITLLDVNNKKPVVMCTTMYVEEGKNAIITPYILRADDRDTKPKSITFSITRVPLHGMILKSGVNVRQFSQADVNAGDVTYLHDGSDTTNDSFFLSITDGAHKKYYLSPNTHQLRSEPFKLNVNISAVDNRPPRVVHNRGVTDLQIFPGKRFGFTLERNMLKAEDLDSDDSTIMYLINAPPSNGILTRKLSSNISLANFTQHDINSRKIFYVLRPQLNVTADVFTFLLSDPAGNTQPQQTFSVVWSRVYFSQPFYAVNETEGVLEVNVQREGFLGTSSFVRIAMKEVTAQLRQDFASFGSLHVQFSPGQTQATWKLRIVDDSFYEPKETLQLRLINPVNCIIGERKILTVDIVNQEDVPKVEMTQSRLAVRENIGRVIVKFRRTGDLSKQLQIMCITSSKTDRGWAKGTLPTSVLSYSDFVIRKKQPESVIRMHKGQATADCHVTVIDDSLYEDEERFMVEIHSYLGSRVNHRRSKTEVTILPDSDDEPIITFDQAQYVSDETDGGVHVIVKRHGIDLSASSSVYLRTKEIEPVSAAVLQDYIPISKLVHFAPHVTSQSVHVAILDDTGLPKMEGQETFKVLLRTPINARLGKTNNTIVVINDTYSDLPIVQFTQSSLTVKEDVGILKVSLNRYGDLSFTSTVRCYTRQDTAKAGKDFTEKTNTDASLVRFNNGEETKNCDILVMDDVKYEGEERFRLVIASNNHMTRIGDRNSMVVSIKDNEDKPLVELEKERQFISEPKFEGQSTYVTVNIMRKGDPTITHRVRLYTMDGTAKAGDDYQPITKILSFSGNTTIRTERVQIIFNKERSIRRVFSVHITSDRTGKESLGRPKTAIFIEKTSTASSAIFPLEPKVVSLRHYDDVNGGSKDIFLGYPLVCITACDPKFSRYSETGSICASQNIDNERTRYRWQSTKTDGSAFSDITDATFFTETNRITLDSVYLIPGLHVRCIARAVTSSGELGLESTSQPVTTNGNKGLCLARDIRHVGSEPFAANISFTGARKDKKANMVHLKVQIPHFDGLIPIISTHTLDVRDVLSLGALRVAQHKCSNTLDANEISTVYGFLNNENIDSSDIIKEVEPYEFSTELRGNTSVRFYKNLNLDSCVWKFENYFHISELIQKCGGSLVSGQHEKALTQSQLSLRVPLYVSYVYRSRKSKSDWLHYDHTTYLRLTLIYDTAVLLKDGFQTPDGSAVKGSLWPISIKIRNADKRLIVRFKTKTKFRGVFILEKEAYSSISMVSSRDLPQLGFTLKLLSGEKSYRNPVQRWEFVSDHAAKDYTGLYYIKLIPCVARVGMTYSEPLTCNPKPLVTFHLPIRFQQIPDPLPARFTLSVIFDITNNKRVWLTGYSSSKPRDETDLAFSRDSKIFGRISLNNGGESRMGYQVYTEKVFICSSDGDLIPSYDPARNQFGCLEDSFHLVHRIKVLDRQSPNSVSMKLGKEAFEAKFASDDLEAIQLAKQSNSDGFVINSAPLFEVPRAQKWFIHTVYSVSSDTKNAKRTSRAVEQNPDNNLHHSINFFHSSPGILGQQSLMNERMRRDNGLTRSLGEGTGTNMKMIRLSYDSAESKQHQDGKTTSADTDSTLVNPLVIGIGAFCIILLSALIVVWILYKRKGRSPEQSGSSGQVSSSNTLGTEV